ncbi:hypothetical protein [Aquimarina megaterium]|uniref:hypothetical protein n=1 Tax=Aquimarina megaterium TaxID=1443666 RepID=UPI000472F176|nr:hypothetical protein [Aquimarina megaterium]
MNLQKLDGEIILRVIVVFIIGIGYGILDRGKFNASFIGYGLSHLVLSYLLGLISFYAYKFIARKKIIDKKKRKVAIWNISIFWALFILIWLGIL